MQMVACLAKFFYAYIRLFSIFELVLSGNTPKMRMDSSAKRYL